MFRRSRFSVRPNVGATGRTAAGTSQEPPAANQETSTTQKDQNKSNDASIANSSDVIPSENAPGTGNGIDQNGEGAGSSASVQRRKRFSVKPKVAPGRPLVVSRTLKSPVEVSVTPSDAVCGSDKEKPSTSSQPPRTPAPRGIQSPKQGRLSEEEKQHKKPPTITPTSSEIPEPSTVSPPKESTECSKQVENISTGQTKEVNSRSHDRVPPSIPDKEATEISEKAKTLISKNVISITPSALSLSRLLNDPSDVQRMIKAQKLRELLRRERCKEKKIKRSKACRKEFTLDPTKMTMRDLIHYLPTSNPMTSSLDEENEMVIPPSPKGEQSTAQAALPEIPPIKVNSREEEEEDEEEAAAEEDQEDSLMVPRVKVAEDGSLIIDEESLMVEVQRAKGPNPASDRDPIFERGSTTTYSSFRKSTYAKPWSIEETDMFYLAVSMVGTDFSMICQLFPHRARSEIKNKFKKEERVSSWRIDKAFRERRKLDIEYFSKLLEKILEFQKEKKKLKSLVEKNSKRKSRTKAKGKKSVKSLSDVEDEDDSEMSNLEEKENEERCTEGETPAKKPKRGNKVEALSEEPNEKKSKSGDVPDDSEAALPESHTDSDISKDPCIKPANLSRARALKPTLPLGMKRGKKGKSEETESNKGVNVNEDESNLCKTRERSATDDISSEEEAVTIKNQRPTRYGRVPKPTRAFSDADKEESHSSEAETASASKSEPKRAVKRAKSLKPQSEQKAKKAKLVTLRSSKLDFSDEEDEEGQDMSSKDLSASVPTGLHSLNAVISEVDDPMAELDILDGMPDMLSISQADSSSHHTQPEPGTAEACDHQLDLLVDVIDIFTTEETEVSQDESYNEAAQTLLTIGNVGHISQAAQGELFTQGPTSGTAVDGNKSEPLDEKVVLNEQQQSPCPHKDGETDPENRKTSSSDTSHVTTIEPICDEIKTVHDELSSSHVKPKSQSSSNNSPSSKMVRSSKVKPKPNLGRASRTAPSTSQTDMSKEQQAEGSCSISAVEMTSPVVEPNIPQKKDKSGNSLITQGDLSSISLSRSESSSEEARHTSSSDHKDVTVAPPVETIERSESEVTLVVREPCTISGSFQDSSNEHPSPEPEKDFSVSQTSMDPVAPRRSRLSKVKPNLPQMSRVALNKCQTSKETLKKDSLTTSNSEPQTQIIKDLETPTTSLNPTEEVMKTIIKVEHQAGHQNTPEVQSSPEPEAEQESTVVLAQIPEDSCNPATFDTVVDDRPGNKGQANVSSASQLRRSRLQKPKPNLTQSSRSEKTKHQSTENAATKASGINPESREEVQTVCTLTSVQVTESDRVSNLNPIQTSDSIHFLTEKHSTNEEKNAGTGVDQVDKETESDQSARADQNTIDVTVDQSRTQSSSDSGLVSEFPDKDSISHKKPSDISCPTGFRCDPVQDQHDQPSAFIRPEEESSVCTQDDEPAAAAQAKRKRYSKIKPRPNLPQTSRVAKKSPTSENRPEKHTLSEQTATEPELNTAMCGLSSEKQSEKNTNPAFDLRPPLSSEAVGTPSEMKKTPTDDEASTNLTVSETKTQNSNLNSEPSEDQSTKEQESTSNDNLAFPAEMSPDVSTTEVTSEHSQVTQKDDKVPSAQQVKRSRSQNHKPNLLHTSRPARPKGDGESEEQSKLAEQTMMEKEKFSEFTDLNPTPLGEASESITVSPTVSSTSTGLKEVTFSDKGTAGEDQTEPPATFAGNLPAGDQTNEKSIPGNLTTMQLMKKHESPISEESRKFEDEELPNVGQVSSAEKTTSQKRKRFSKIKPKPNLPSCCSVKVINLRSRPLDEQIDEQQLESAEDNMSNNAPADLTSVSSGDCNLDVPLAVAAHTGNTVLPSISDVGASTHQRNSVPGNPTSSELSDFSKNSGKPPQGRRGSLIKPKPVLRCSSRLQKSQPVENSKPTETESDSTSQAPGTSGDQEFAPEQIQDVPEIEKEVTDKSSSHDAHTSLGCFEQDSANKHETSSTEGIQRDFLLSEILPERVPSDPDEPFFILSLMEIPVSAAGEVENSGAANLSYLPVAGASGQQSSVTDLSLKAEDHPKLSQEANAFNNAIPEPNEMISEDLVDKKTILSCIAEVSALGKSEVKTAETETPPCGKAVNKGNVGKAPSGAAQMSPLKATFSSSSFLPTQTRTATETPTPSAAAHVGLSSKSPALTSQKGESGFSEDEPTSVSQYFLSDIFTEMEEG